MKAEDSHTATPTRRRVAAAFLGFSTALIVGIGSAIAAFSGDGTQTTDFGNGKLSLDQAEGVAIQSDGRIIAAGVASPGGIALAGYAPDGELDNSFSGDGKVITGFAGGSEDVAIQANDKIVAVGGGNDKFAVARYMPDGELDDSFSENGKVTTKFGNFAVARGVAIQADGKIVVAGDAADPDGQIALARYRKNGELDDSFSGNGKKLTDFDRHATDQAADVALAPDGKILTAGGTTAAKNDTKFLITRHKANGALDRSFTGDGMRKVSFPRDCCSAALGVAVQDNGRIVTAGGSGGRFALPRLRQSGRLDDSFGGDGRVKTGGFPGPGGSAWDLVIQANGRIVVAGRTGSAFGLARYRKDGSLDDSFSGDGRQATPLGSANAVAIQADGKIVAAGLTGHPEYDFLLARYLTNGELDD